MNVRRHVMTTAALWLLGGTAFQQPHGEVRELNQYVLIMASMVQSEQLNDAYRERSKFLLKQMLDDQMPSVRFDYRNALPDGERSKLLAMGDEILQIRMTGDGAMRKVEIGLESDFHRVQVLSNVVTAEGVSVQQMVCNSPNLRKIVRRIREHHAQCHATGKECAN